MSRRSALVLLLLLGVALGARGWLVFTASPSDLLHAAGRMAVVEGVVADDPDVRATAVRTPVSVSALNGALAEGVILAVLPRDSAVQYGDRVVVRGVLEVPEPFETQTGRMFDYSRYLETRGVSLVMQRAVLRDRQDGGASVLRLLFFLKHAFERGLERVMEEPMASLMEGFLLGEKSGLPPALTQAFIIAGLIHVVVLSGYNIGVVSEWTLRLFAAVLPRRAALGATAAVIVLFALMAGGGMATVRACLMGLIAILARYLNRSAAALRALCFAAAAMFLYNPLVVTDAGFMLSVLATFGLITLAPWVEEKLTLLPAGGIRSTAGTTIAVQLFVLPALLYYSGVLSFVSVPINVLVLPLIPLAMLLGFAAGLLALLHPLAAFIPALAADLLLRIMIWLTETAAALPFASTVVPAFSGWIALLAYLPLTAWAGWIYRSRTATMPADVRH